jgi:hypothetical protein
MASRFRHFQHHGFASIRDSADRVRDGIRNTPSALLDLKASSIRG